MSRVSSVPSGNKRSPWRNVTSVPAGPRNFTADDPVAKVRGQQTYPVHLPGKLHGIGQRQIAAKRNAGEPNALAAGRAGRQHEFSPQPLQYRAVREMLWIGAHQHEIQRKATAPHRLREAGALEFLRPVKSARQQRDALRRHLVGQGRLEHYLHSVMLARRKTRRRYATAAAEVESASGSLKDRRIAFVIVDGAVKRLEIFRLRDGNIRLLNFKCAAVSQGMTH